MAASEADARSAFIGREELSALALSNVEVRGLPIKRHWDGQFDGLDPA